MNIFKATQIFPMMSDEELKALAEDIKQNGLLNPVVLYRGLILDGRNRLKACEIAGVEPCFVEFDGDNPVAFVISQNIKRRHLTTEQRAALALELLPELEKEAEGRKRAGVTIRPEVVHLEERIPQGSGRAPQSTDLAGKVVGVSGRVVRQLKAIRETDPDKFNEVVKGEKTIGRALTEIKHERIQKEFEVKKASPIPDTTYRCIVVDPPWPVDWIPREVRPLQGGELDYPTMTVDEIMAIPVGKLADSDGCHVYLWTTQRFLPTAFEVFKAWGVKYQCVLTWIKNVGFTPFSWMYSTEFVLFGRVGSLQLLKVGKRTDFTGKVREHSRKPDEFYDLVREVSPGPRLDMFAREAHDGFETWGNETSKF